jgi:hypothetical protein
VLDRWLICNHYLFLEKHYQLTARFFLVLIVSLDVFPTMITTFIFKIKIL